VKKKKDNRETEKTIEQLEKQALLEYRKGGLRPFVAFWLFGIDKTRKDLFIYLFYLISMITAFLYFQFASPHIHYGVNLFALVPSVMLFSSFLSMESRRRKGERYPDSLSRFYLSTISALGAEEQGSNEKD
jgi:hypothetical protein